VCGIKVIAADGRPCDTWLAFARPFAKILSKLALMIGYLMVPFDDKKRGLHDHLAGTVCVHAI
jgi:uncharacterized RDD family membrane protein YckC